MRFKTLAEDAKRDTATMLIELAPAAVFPDHDHSAGLGAGETFVISGDLVIGGRLHHPGSYIPAAAGSAHYDTWSPSGCVALMTLSAQAQTHSRLKMGLPVPAAQA